MLFMPKYDFYGKEDRPWPGKRLSSASIVGHTSTDSVRLWFRVFAEGEYQLVLRAGGPIDIDAMNVGTRAGKPTLLAGKPRKPVPGSQVHEKKFRRSSDLTGVFDVSGLQPGTRYHYALRRKDVKNAFDWEWEIGYEAELSFETYAPDPDEVSFGLYSCHMPFDELDLVNMDMWRAFHSELTEARASFVLGGGDQVYSDGNDKVSIWRYLRKVKRETTNIPLGSMVSWYRDIYRGYWSMPLVQRVYRDFPNYMIWDDHEIMDGWGSYSESELSNQLDTFWELEDKKKNLALADKMWRAAQQVYDEYEHSHNPDPPRHADKKGVRNWHYTFDCGMASFFVLDMRGHRRYRSKNDADILGKEQMADLKAWLASRPKSTRVCFIVASVPVVHASSFVVNWLDLPFSSVKDDVRDHWEHPVHRDERDEMLKAVFEHSHENDGRRVVFLSGDVHIAAALKLYSNRFPDAQVYQATSSGITFAKLSDLMRKAVSFTVRDHGELEPARGSKPLGTYTKLAVLPRNNFGVVRVRKKGSDADVSLDLFGKADVPGGIVRLERVPLGD